MESCLPKISSPNTFDEDAESGETCLEKDLLSERRERVASISSPSPSSVSRSSRSLKFRSLCFSFSPIRRFCLHCVAQRDGSLDSALCFPGMKFTVAPS